MNGIFVDDYYCYHSSGAVGTVNGYFIFVSIFFHANEFVWTDSHSFNLSISVSPFLLFSFSFHLEQSNKDCRSFSFGRNVCRLNFLIITSSHRPLHNVQRKKKAKRVFIYYVW